MDVAQGQTDYILVKKFNGSEISNSSVCHSEMRN
jgi:hypothetical protein